jgi:hypothetical protein
VSASSIDASSLLVREPARAERGQVMTDHSITPEAGSSGMEGHLPGIRLSPLFEALLNSTRHLISIRQPTAAVVTAQTAIEVCTERLISKSLALRGAAFLDAWIDDRLRSYNVESDHVKSLYKAVTEDITITDQPFWRDLKAHVKLRNEIAHEGKTATEQEANVSLIVAEQIINHMTSIAASKSLDLGD